MRLPVALIGMNAKLMSQYIEFVADRWFRNWAILKYTMQQIRLILWK